MEVVRHSRRRSRAHSFIANEKKSNKHKSKKNKHSKKPKIYRDIERDWKRNKY